MINEIYFNNKEINKKMIKSIQIVIKSLLFKIINCYIYILITLGNSVGFI